MVTWLMRSMLNRLDKYLPCIFHYASTNKHTSKLSTFNDLDKLANSDGRLPEILRTKTNHAKKGILSEMITLYQVYHGMILDVPKSIF